ncbi:hypothetical protein EDB81DRAFT_860155 [Dactylonectria macrodidyma]|uniref:Ankyrin n=1 Tax=Dactylonectria macrodidyma TaxID=307937 RepID=A0A9P9IQX2_9HYPO|nr:hypothetical protein EDB81DRAFT_860155 [Dactylonectria macrodidyma]
MSLVSAAHPLYSSALLVLPPLAPHLLWEMAIFSSSCTLDYLHAIVDDGKRLGGVPGRDPQPLPRQQQTAERGDGPDEGPAQLCCIAPDPLTLGAVCLLALCRQRSYRAQLKKWGYTKYNRRIDPSMIKRFGFEYEREAALGRNTEVGSGCGEEVDPEHSNQADVGLNKDDSAKPNTITEPTSSPRPHTLSPSHSPKLSPNLNPLRRKGRIKRRALQTKLHPATYLPSIQYLSEINPAHPQPSANTPTLPSLPNEHRHHVEPPPVANPPIRLPRIRIPFDQDGLNLQDDDGKTRLHHAVLCMDTAQVRTLLADGARVNIKDRTGNEVIHYSVVAGGDSILELLLQFGADIDAKGALGRSPLHCAASSAFGLFDAVIKAGADVSIQDENGDTPLHLAISTALGDVQLISAMDLEAIMNSGCDVNLPNYSGLTPFVKLLDRPYSQPKVLGAIYSCLLRGGSINDIQPDGRTPFQIFLARSVTQGSRWIKRICGYSQEGVLEKQILEAFLDKGGSISTLMPSGASLYAYYFAIALEPLWRQDAEIMDIFCRLSPPGPLESSGDCILHRLAANCGPLSQAGSAVNELLQRQLDKGADPNFRNRDGKTPLLCLFASSGNATHLSMRAMAPLLSRGADPWQQDLSEADLRQVDSRVRHDKSKDRFCWNDWDSATKAASWSESKHHILARLNPLPAGVDEVVRGAALSALAGKHIHLSRARFSGDANEAKSRHCYVADILRDCRSRHLFVDMAWVDHLLELCVPERSEVRAVSINPLSLLVLGKKDAKVELMADSLVCIDFPTALAIVSVKRLPLSRNRTTAQLRSFEAFK